MAKRSRRELERSSRALVLLTVAALALSLGAAGCGREGPETGLVLVTIDTCRADRIGCYAEGLPARTPTLDALAARGARFEQVQAPVPLTLPSHCTVLTGLYPDRHTVRDNGAARLPDEAVTIAELLRESGWATAAFLSAFPLDSEFGADQGFDRYDDDLEASSVGRFAGRSQQAEDAADRFFYDERTADATVDAALPWIEDAARGDRPFFAWIHFFDPHATYDPPARFVRGTGLDAYAGEIAHVDEQIARLLEALEGMDDRVVVAVTADHGESLGEHEEVSHGLFVYEGTLRVPWILAGPEVPAGAVVSTPVSLVHVAPTLLDLVGAAVPPNLDGESLVPLLRGEELEPFVLHSESLFARLHFDWAGLRSVRSGRWKLIDAPRPELYDLEADPGELRNLAAAHPERVSELRSEMRAHAARGGALSTETVEVDDETRRRLEALGYVGGSEPESAEVDSDLWNPTGADPKDRVDSFNRFQEVPTLMMSGREDEAAALLEELREEEPTNRNVIEKLALVRRMQERWEDARDACLAFLELAPDDERVRRNLAHAHLELDDPAEARAQYLELLARHPQSARTWGLLAALDLEHGSPDAAVDAAARAAEIEPDVASRRVLLARARGEAGAVAEALAEYDRALALEPTLAEAVNGKALLLSHHGRPREAVAVLKGGLPALADDVDTLNNLAWILVERSIDPAQAWTHAQRAAELTPDDPVVLDTLGWAAIRSGRPREGIAPLEKAWRATGDAEVRAHLGVAMAESGQESQGSLHVREAVAERPALAEIPEVARWNR